VTEKSTGSTTVACSHVYWQFQ